MMDFLVELIGELVTLPFDLAMESSRVEVWVKTLLMSLVTAFVIGVFLLVTILVAKEGVLWKTLAVAALSVVVSAFLVYWVIRGHRKGWKDE